MFDITGLLIIFAATAPLVCLMAFRWPELFMMAAFLMTPFQQALIGEDSPIALGVVDIIASLLLFPLVFKFVRVQRLKIGAVSWVVGSFLLICLVSTFAAGMSVSGVISLVRMMMNTLVPILIFANLGTSLKTCHKCYMCFLVACNILSVCVLFAFVTGGIQASMYTLGLHKNFIGPLLGCGVCSSVVSLMLESPRGRKRSWLIATLVMASIGLLFSLSRGAWFATALGLLLAVFLTRNVMAIAASVLLGLVTMSIAWQFLPADSVEYASNISTEAHTAQTRFESIDIVMQAFHTSPIVGVGVELRKEVEPHNVLVLTLGETGVLGIIGFSGMFLVAFRTIFSARNLVKSDPIANSVMSTAAVIMCVSLADGILDVYWRRGVGFMGWAGVGMAVNLLATQTQTKRRLGAVPRKFQYRTVELEI